MCACVRGQGVSVGKCKKVFPVPHEEGGRGRMAAILLLLLLLV